MTTATFGKQENYESHCGFSLAYLENLDCWGLQYILGKCYKLLNLSMRLLKVHRIDTISTGAVLDFFCTAYPIYIYMINFMF